MAKCLWLTGLPCSGKTTLARGVQEVLPDVEVLDGDEVRDVISHGLGFSVRDRIENNRRIAWVAAKLVRAGVNTVVAAVSPHRAGRDVARSMISRHGTFREIYVKASPETCEGRDVKGMWGLAREGKIENFTGLDGEYEEPENPYMILDTEMFSVETLVSRLVSEIQHVPYKLFIGRWQPFHRGHQYIIEEALKAGPVAVGIRLMKKDDNNPYSYDDRVRMIRAVFPEQWEMGRIITFPVPNISSIHIGRNVGYGVVRYSVPEEIAEISATKARSVGDYDGLHPAVKDVIDRIHSGL